MGTAERVRVLLVDDNVDVANVTQMHLQRHDDAFDVVVAEGAAAALDVLDESFDCIVSDYEMPRVDGLELLREVRECTPSLPFILFTGRGSEEIASEAVSAGVTDYLQKETGTDQYTVLANRIRNAVEHRRSRAAAAESESRYRSLVEGSPHPILIHDDSDIHYVNERTVDLAGVETREQLLGRDPLEFVHPDDREMITERTDRVLNGGSVEWREFRLQRPDGEIRNVESRASQVTYEGETASQAVLRDVTDRNQRERRLEALHEATRRLMTAATRETAGEITIETLASVFDEPVTAVWKYKAAENVLDPLATSENAAQVAIEAGLEPGASPLPEWTVEMTVFESGDQRVVEDYGDREDVVTDAFESVLLHPLGEYGLLAIASPTPRSFDDGDRDLIGILARSVVATFDRLETPQS